ncbi:MAG TPA: MotA/TolQ/ExbB proton channel family protein [Bacteroidales bacterium]|nr:MotA/TolQ/ExbB proton channel family protein [Bacteroidales bacterium]
MNFYLLQIQVAAEAAKTQAEKSMTLWELTLKGGWIMIPLAILAFVAIFIFIERFLAIRKAASFESNFIDRIKDYIHEGKIDAALNLCSSTDRPVARMIEKGIKRIGRPIKEIEDSIEIVGKFEVYNLEKNLVILGVIAGIAPMFGFIGTIAGVIKIFYNISLADNISIGLIAGGLYEKMVTSAAGLLIGIIAYIFYHWLNVMIEKVVHKLELNAVNFIDLLQEPA